jgi:hypothetical protein
MARNMSDKSRNNIPHRCSLKNSRRRYQEFAQKERGIVKERIPINGKQSQCFALVSMLIIALLMGICPLA